MVGLTAVMRAGQMVETKAETRAVMMDLLMA